ncbi:DNA topoisomerase 2 [Phtheirospermum japonicum]|uniref:DNA topoisomerase 2 n=1 Tax=Phtheirospermum japonicum TaxID=374723 RepID=A0A830BZK0_9LAMI|nr:DNA topoisomerase 2 [Phtheirospermum japonicum]
MAGAKKAPLTTSNNANIPPPETVTAAGGGRGGGKKTIEQTYQKKTQLEHILLRPDTYIGSIEKHTQNLWVYENEQMVQKSITFVPGLYKIFDEILVNAADNKQRDPKMDSVKVTIDVESACISVYNNGDGVPVEIHQEEGVYVPELIFGHLLTSSNYDDDEKKTTGGRNGYGAKLTNIFSTEFVIETADGKRQKKYKQVFSNNMGTKSEPVITKCKAGENWTRITFKPDLAKFSMSCLEEDVVALMKKRAIDVAGCLGKTVKVELNGQLFHFKSFSSYCDLYMKSPSVSSLDPLPRFEEEVHDRWQVCISRSEGQFQQVSFVNGIATVKGGTHVDYVTNKITSHLVNVIKNKNKKNKKFDLKPHTVKNHLWVFVNALIDNPAFDSQTKETLTLRAASFGSSWDFSPKFLDKVAKSDIMKNIEEWAEFKQQKDLKKTDGAKNKRIYGLAKLCDANEAGGKNSEKCTLILTEGDSAKALAIAGLSVVGRDHYGVFPLRGKLLNVREASHNQIMQNAEIQHIKQILGLQQGKQYESVKPLRYGHLMIMTDQDHDGSHIKGLLINFIHSFWPSLLKVPTFLLEFITPIVKASHKDGKKKLSFYTMPQYEAWKENQGIDAKSWTIKYYKGLGTSTDQEGKEYFEDLGKHKKDFVWEDEQDGDAIELAFSKKKIEARKSWLRQFEPGTYLDDRDKHIKYRDFVHKELILFSMADLQRSIPSMVDGLKPGQRKILFCSFKRNFIKEAKVAQFSGYVSEHSAYHHGEQSLAGTIIGMAQDYVGSNNINLLLPNGQFGTRGQGGKDHASARYIYTQLSPITRFLFPKADDILLDYLNEDGQSIEPTWYVPIIPMVLVNGSEGIGTGWSTFIPNYNPLDIIANVRHLLNDEPMEPMHPWYKGFIGSVEISATKESGTSYTVTGIIEEEEESTLKITELPIRKWTQDYKEFLESISAENANSKDPFIESCRDNSGGEVVQFSVHMSAENLLKARQEGLLKKFKLTTSIATSNMHLFDSRGLIKKYDTPEQILEEFFYKVLLANLENDMLKCDNKYRFIRCVVDGSIVVSNRKRADLFIELKEKGFTPFPKKKPAAEIAVAGATDDADESEETNDISIGQGVSASDYDYLLSLAIGTLTVEKMQELRAERDKLMQEVEELRTSTVKSLWTKDLDALETKFVEDLTKCEKKWEESRQRILGDAKVAKPVQKNPRKNTKKASTKASTVEPMEVSDNTVTETEKVVQVKKPRGKAAAKKKAPVEKVAEVAEEDNDDVADLRQRLAAYNFDSSPDRSEEMETEQPQVPAKNKQPNRRAAALKKPLTTVDDEDEDDEVEIIDDDDFEPEEKKKKGGRRKPVNAKATKPPLAGTKKRGPAANSKQSQNLGQKLITEVLKPAENSPEKKVRKMRASPFNKKSSSILGRAAAINLDDDEEEDMSPEQGNSVSSLGSGTDNSEVVARRPQRGNRTQAKYVISDDEPDEDTEVSDAADEEDDDSDFDEE